MKYFILSLYSVQECNIVYHKNKKYNPKKERWKYLFLCFMRSKIYKKRLFTELERLNLFDFSAIQKN